MNNTFNDPTENQDPSTVLHLPLPTANASTSQAIGCLGPVIAVLLFGALGSSALGAAGVMALFSGLESQAPGWLPAAYNLMLAIPAALVLVPLAIFWPDVRYRGVFQAWSLGLLHMTLLAPVGLLPETAAQGQALLRILLELVYLVIVAGVMVIKQKRTNSPAPAQGYAPSRTQAAGRWMLAITLGALLALPWLAWGALGSVLDTFLQAASGLAMGLAAGLTLEICLAPLLLHPEDAPTTLRLRNFLLAGFAASTWLLLLAAGTAFPYFIMQILLIVYLPALGWLAAGLYRWRAQPAQAAASGWRRLALDHLPASLLIGLAAAAPLAWIDADELFLLVSMSGGEILSWAARAAGAALLMGFFLGTPVGLLLALRREKAVEASRARLALVGGIGGMLLACGLNAAIFFGIGQPGFYGDGYFVVLKAQADVSQAPTIIDYAQRRRFVYDTLTAHANTTQAELRTAFKRLGLDYTPYYLVNAIQVEGGPLLKVWLQTRPEVDRVLDNPWLRPLPEKPPVSPAGLTAAEADAWNLALIGADRVQAELGIAGAGIVVGQSDSGVQGDHPEVASRYRGLNTDGSLVHDYNWLDPWFGTMQPSDIGGHGTHTLGSILGQQTGVAPEAQWIGCVNLARNLGNPALYLDCMQFMLAPYPQAGDALRDGAPERGAHVLNNSWGCPEIEGCDPQALVAAVEALRAAGIFVVASAGNDGPACETVKDPVALYDAVFSVGAVDRRGQLAEFSSRGPVTADGSGRIKPDILAPGVEVFSSMPGGTYGENSGTSMAGPHVVGVVALLWSANPALIGDIERTEQILIDTATPYSGILPDCPGAADHPSSAVGYGIVNAYAAVKEALSEP